MRAKQTRSHCETAGARAQKSGLLLDPETRTAALRRLLRYCHNSQFDLDVGRLLGPALLGRLWAGVDDDELLVIALEQVLAAELAAARRTAGVPDPPEDASYHEWLKADLRPDIPQLGLYSLMWAYGVERIATVALAEVCARSRRRIEQLIFDEGCPALAQVLGAHERQVVPNGNTIPLAEQSVGASIVLPPQYIAKNARRRSSPRVTQNCGIVVGEQHGGVIHQYNYGGDSVRGHRDRTTWTQRLLAALILNIVIALSLALPHGTALGMGVLGVWRCGAVGWRLRREWWVRSREERAWFAGLAGCWGAIGGAAAVLAVAVAGYPVFPLVTAQGPLLLLCFVMLAVALLLAALLDGACFLLQRDPAHWLWERLQPYALGCWDGRWYLLAASWVVVVCMLAIRWIGG